MHGTGIRFRVYTQQFLASGVVIRDVMGQDAYSYITECFRRFRSRGATTLFVSNFCSSVITDLPSCRGAPPTSQRGQYATLSCFFSLEAENYVLYKRTHKLQDPTYALELGRVMGGSFALAIRAPKYVLRLTVWCSDVLPRSLSAGTA